MIKPKADDVIAGFEIVGEPAFSRTGMAGALGRAGTAVRSLGEADSMYYFNRTSFNMARTCRGL